VVQTSQFLLFALPLSWIMVVEYYADEFVKMISTSSTFMMYCEMEYFKPFDMAMQIRYVNLMTAYVSDIPYDFRFKWDLHHS